ncbi:MAG: bifunctional adenosylcobinamide kinase/adenosylcobinamide-phosphate guanylyltransferase [Pseudomonadota bacterium]|nr:bifunctional adenosylcobinamide kinase/adenosylcobinamide-phosphate guanylyltransferase [Pseudomonadota bacterium]
MRELVLGGIRSGKSRYAIDAAMNSGMKQVVFIATARAEDAEMHARIRRHRRERPVGWRTYEEPVALAQALESFADRDVCLLVDCMNLWLSNLMQAGEPVLREQRNELLGMLALLPGRLILVSNEVGGSLVPINPLARRFVDELGRLNQLLARSCDRVTLVTAGLPLRLKEGGSA